MGSAMVAAHGFAAPETGRAYERALELTERIGDLHELFPVLYGLCLYHLYGADLAAARAAAQRPLDLAEKSDDAGFRFFAHRAEGVSAYPAGDLAGAREHLQRALALYDPAEHRAPAFVYAFDPRVVCLDYLARTLLPLGEVEAALRHSREALAEARRLGHRNSLCLPLFFGATLRQQIGDREAVLELQAELAAIAEEERFPIWAAGAKILHGWAAVDSGDGIAGAALIEEGVRDWQATGARLMLPYFEALLADATRRAGSPGEAAAQLRGALKRAEASGERWFAAELHRRLGETHATQGDAAKAQAEAAAALELACGQGARLWELRAALDLAGLLAERGDGKAAAARLEPLLAELGGCRGLPEFAAATRLLARLGAAPALLATT
jgi:predicted ATPase